MQISPSAAPHSRLTSAFQGEAGRTVLLTLLVQLAVLVLGMLDFATGVRFQFTIIYLAPISFAALRGGLASGVITSATSAAAWFLAGKYGGADFGTGWIACWNALARLIGFSLMAIFLSRSYQLNRRLRNVSELVIAAQEAERRRIAADLHDSVNQLLSTVTFRLGMIVEQLAGANQPMTAELEKAKQLLAKGIEEIHRISEGLRPSELDALGLAPALRSLCREFQQKTGLALKFEMELSSKRLSDAVELTLYRITQEALNNIEKHSGATRAILRLTENGACLKLLVQDNGRGLEPPSEKAKPVKKTGMGLLNMRERTAFLGGTFSIHSTAEKGTEIHVQIPTLPHGKTTL